MKVLYDHQIFTIQKYGGISRYFFELIKEFDDLKDIQTKTSVLLSNNYYISNKYYVKYINFLPKKEFYRKQWTIYRINKINSIFQLKKQNFDIFHPTYYDSYFLKYIDNVPFIVTVHDMIHEKFSDMFGENNKISENKRIICEKASTIIAVSKNTKKDLIELFGVDESKIEVVYHGNSMVLDYTKALNVQIPERYILFVGLRSAYKNFDKFIHGVALLLNENSNLSIVCVGGGKFNTTELTVLEKLNIENKVFQFNLDDDTLAQFYSRALMFVFPSLYEGFGIPILESFACSCPLVCSNTSSLPEIADDGAEYFDPYSEKSIYDAIKKVLNNDEHREILIKKGRERLKSFSWKQTAIQTKKVYQSVLRKY